TEVSGVVIGQGNVDSDDTGIAPGAGVVFATLDNLNLGFGAAGQQDAALRVQSVAQQADTPVINMSWGFFTTKTTVVPTDGTTLVTRAIDWEATRYDKLMVVAGNEGSAGAPSDSYNSINVASTGAIVGGMLNYGVASPYNTSNITTDISPFTGYGRIKTDIIAPGGDPGPGAQALGTFNAQPAYDNQFLSTAGGQYEYDHSDAGGVPFYNQDSMDGNVTSHASASASDNKMPFIAGPPYAPTNPGANLGGTDFVETTTIAGTSFAAPLVSGASTLLYQESSLMIGGSSDHRLMKALLLNGASHTYNNLPLVRADGVTPWTRLPGASTKSALLGFSAAQYNNALPKIRPGLDPQLGTGMLNIPASLANLDAGEQGYNQNVAPTGWDINTVLAGTLANTLTNFYQFDAPYGGTFSATLCWDDPVSITNPGANNSYQGASTLTRNMLTDLDLYLFKLTPSGSTIIYDYSTSDIDNVEYLYDTLTPGSYDIIVANASYAAPSDTTFALAWMTVPEPAALAWLAMAIPLLKRRATRAARPAA
ncbi:MAG TPA: S8 family serine peptidase, partial [Bryobacteraceae bacterium]|nr:S8 family serine peptidase [Bryobacteraceae bacterium]